MYGSYGIGEPAHPALSAYAARVGRHEGADRNEAAGGIAVPITESRAVGEPGIVHLDPALGRVARQQDEMLVDAEANLGYHGPSGIELGDDGAQVGTEPAGKGHPTVGIAGDGVPDELIVIGVAAV